MRYDIRSDEGRNGEDSEREEIYLISAVYNMFSNIYYLSHV
jgi:hypothetical protein